MDTAAGGACGGTVLHLAARCRAVESLKLLLAAGADHSVRDSEGRTALFYAAVAGDTLSVRELTAAGAAVDTSSCSHGFTALMAAVVQGQQETAALLMSARGTGGGPEVEMEGLSLLHLAADRGEVRMMTLLLEADAETNINAQDNEHGWAPLHCAAAEGRTAAIDLLLRHGADPNLSCNDGRTALHFAAEGGHSDAIERLAEAGARLDAFDAAHFTPLLAAAARGHQEGVWKLLRLGANPNVANELGNTALAKAVLRGHVGCVKELLEVTDLARHNKIGRNVLHSAVIAGRFDIFQILLPSFTGSVDVRTMPDPPADETAVSLKTCLHLASNFGHSDMVAALLRAGANRMLTDSHLHTPLHYAAHEGRLECIKLLLAGPPGAAPMTPAEVDAADSSGATPLHYAAMFGSTDCFGIHIPTGASRESARTDGVAPRRIAVARHASQPELVALLTTPVDEEEEE